MSINISEVFQSIAEQQIPALIAILTKAGKFAAETGAKDSSLLAARLSPDMHPLSWQIQTTLELLGRGVARLSGDEPVSLALEESKFSELISRVEEVRDDLSKLDTVALDQSAEKVFEIPLGPDSSLSLSGTDYVMKFMLPNFYFHLTTTYDLLRMSGVPLGKLDFMGPVA